MTNPASIRRGMLSSNRSEALARAYPGIPFRPHTRGWLARLMRAPAECAHLETEQSWMACYAPDTLYLRGKARRTAGARPEVSLCRTCLTEALLPELKAFRGRVVVFEPNPEVVTQYFFLANDDFHAAGLLPETAAAIERRMAAPAGHCQRGECACAAPWLWLGRDEVESPDFHGNIGCAAGLALCATHGAEQLCRAVGAIPDANLLYINAPYGELGAYIWI